MRINSLFFTWIALLLPFLALAQNNADPELFVGASAGNFVTSTDGYQMSWTMGEAIAFDAIEPGGHSMLAGYQQGVNKTIILVPTLEFEERHFEVNIFPNPTSQILFVDMDERLQGNAQMYVIDSQGKILLKTPSLSYLDVNPLPAGNYFLVIRNDIYETAIPFIISK